jgi:hypothetical protein
MHNGPAAGAPRERHGSPSRRPNEDTAHEGQGSVAGSSRRTSASASPARHPNDTLVRLADTNLLLHRSLIERGWNMRYVHRRTPALLRRVKEALTETRATVARNGGEVTRIRKWNTHKRVELRV